MTNHFDKLYALKVLPVELRLLLASLHITNESQKRKMIGLLSSSDIDWNYFLKLVVERHRLTGSVYKNLWKYSL